MSDFSLGLVEVSALGHAINMLDEMLKVADAEFVATERKLGGRLVTIVVRGNLSAVKASVEAGAEFARKNECLKASQVIARPHPEIFKFLHLDEEEVKATAEIAGTHVGKVPSKKESESAKPAKRGRRVKKTEEADK